MKTKALSEELENPINIHRWRKLESTDSEAYELINKIQALQKRLILKCEELSSKSNTIKIRETDLDKIKELLKR